MSDGSTISFAIITCSDTRTLETDTAGAALAELVAAQGWTLQRHIVVTDERPSIAAAILEAVDQLGVDIVLTCGGTGLSPRDETPEATTDVCPRDVPGIAEAMRAHSMEITGRAMLSRAVCRQRGKTLVVNLPGSLKAARENWDAIYEQFEHAVSMAAGGGH